MKVKLFANLVDLADERTMDVSTEEASTLREALEAVFDRAPDLREEVLEDDGTPCEHINIVVNGNNIAHEDEGLERAVEADDEIAIFPPVSGG